MRRKLPLLAALAALLATPAAAAAAPKKLRGARAPVSQLEQTSSVRSFGVTFRRYRQEMGGLPVIGGEVVLSDAPGSRADLLLDRSRRLSRPGGALLDRRAGVLAARTRLRGRLRLPARASLAILPSADGPRTVWRVLLGTSRPFGSFEALVDARSGDVLRVRSLLHEATGTASLFVPNPVVTNGGLGTLRDNGDADSPELTALRRPVQLPRLSDATTCLVGQWVHAVIGAASSTPGDVCSGSRDWTSVTRSDDRFEALMAYFHVDRAQSYIQALGFTNAMNRQLQVNADGTILDAPLTEQGQDNSYYDSLTRDITLGTGYVDDGEDGETILHEYGHAIQDDQVPGFGTSDDSGAMGEGFGDYFASAMSATFDSKPGFDACFDEWDAYGTLSQGDSRPTANPPCLRRVDYNLRPGQTSPDCPRPANVHCRGEIWSGALWAVRSAIGAQAADRLVIQAQFGLPAEATFDQASRSLVAADRALYGGTHRNLLVSVLGSRGLVDAERLDDTPADAAPLALPGRVSGRISEEGDQVDVYRIDLSARHPLRLRLAGSGGDLDLALYPPGTTSLEAAAAARSNGGTSSELIAYDPPRSGSYYVAVQAAIGSGSYTLDATRDARIRLTSARGGRRVAAIRGSFEPTSLSARAFRLRVERRTCRSGRCRYRRVKTVSARRARSGRVSLRLRLRPARYRLQAVLSARGYPAVKSHRLGLRVRG